MPHRRGRIEHVQSGESATFQGLDAALDFIRQFGVMAGDTAVRLLTPAVGNPPDSDRPDESGPSESQSG